MKEQQDQIELLKNQLNDARSVNNSRDNSHQNDILARDKVVEDLARKVRKLKEAYKDVKRENQILKAHGPAQNLMSDNERPLTSDDEQSRRASKAESFPLR